jgi:peptidoglycan/LPS O-acetylase OafA/YrhL
MSPITAAPLTSRGPNEARAAVRGRLPFVDGLRGVAMLMVLTYHCWVHTIQAPLLIPISRWHVDVTSPLHLGYLGVHLFLVLSGFCLAYPLAREGGAAMRLEHGRFFRRRAWRILPPYYAALAAFVFLPYLERALRLAARQSAAGVTGVTAGQVVAHLFMVHNFSLAWMGAINGSFWSLALEWQLYLVFPVLVWGFRRWGPIQTVAVVLALTLAYRTWVYRTQDINRLEIGYIYAYALPGRLFEFALGMLAALALARQPAAPHPGGWIRRYLAGALAFGLMGLIVAHRWSLFSPVTDVIWGLSFFCLLMYGGGRSEAGGSWLDSRPLVALGLISYSVYLVHEPLITRGYAALHALHLAPAATLALFEIGVAPLMIALGWLFFRAVEGRFLKRR